MTPIHVKKKKENHKTPPKTDTTREDFVSPCKDKKYFSLKYSLKKLSFEDNSGLKAIPLVIKNLCKGILLSA